MNGQKKISRMKRAAWRNRAGISFIYLSNELHKFNTFDVSIFSVSFFLSILGSSWQWGSIYRFEFAVSSDAKLVHAFL